MTKISPPLLFVGVAGLISLVGMTVFEAAYWPRIFPHISVAAIDIGNLTPAAATQMLSRNLNLPQVTLQSGANQWQIPTAAFNLRYEAEASVTQAYHLGHTQSLTENVHSQFTAFQSSLVLEPEFTLDANLLQSNLVPILAQINIPVQEPAIEIVGGKISVSPGANGQAVDEHELELRIRQAIVHLNSGPIAIPVRKLEPKLSESQVQALQTQAGQLLGKKITLQFNNQSWDVNADQIIAWIDPTTGTLAWNTNAIAKWIAELAQNVDHPAQDAHFRYLGQGRVEEFAPAQPGVAVQQDTLVNSVINSLSSLEANPGPITLAIPVTETQPAVQTSQVNNLGIKELIARGESNYTGSIPNRVFNIHKAAELMNGVLIAPGEEFSFDKYVGDISAAGGYKQAYVIKQGRTVLGDGGGVCQVSTTMFRVALNAGLPITARTAHAYRVHYYENDSQPGFDATIFTPSVDLRFKNDTPTYILIQTVFDDAHNKLAFEFYGTKDGREISLSKSRVWDVTPPPPTLYQDDPTLPTGVVQQVDFSAWGAKAAFDYKVTRNGQVLEQQTFYSNFQPWQAVFLRGTKT